MHEQDHGDVDQQVGERLAMFTGTVLYIAHQQALGAVEDLNHPGDLGHTALEQGQQGVEHQPTQLLPGVPARLCGAGRVALGPVDQLLGAGLVDQVVHGTFGQGHTQAGRRRRLQRFELGARDEAVNVRLTQAALGINRTRMFRQTVEQVILQRTGAGERVEQGDPVVKLQQRVSMQWAIQHARALPDIARFDQPGIE
ncbi:hypothetical protein D3C79_586670 [compost metagenome]